MSAAPSSSSRSVVSKLSAVMAPETKTAPSSSRDSSSTWWSDQFDSHHAATLAMFQSYYPGKFISLIPCETYL